MHDSITDWVKRVLPAENMDGIRVLEVGSYDINGSVRPYIESLGVADYLGVDAQAGPGVDRVVNCEHLVDEFGYGKWQLVVSTEMLEHARNWRTCCEQMAKMVAPRGLLLITTRSPGYPYHPCPDDYWRYTKYDLARIFDILGLVTMRIEDDPMGAGVFGLAWKPQHPFPMGTLDEIDVASVDG